MLVSFSSFPALEPNLSSVAASAGHISLETFQDCGYLATSFVWSRRKSGRGCTRERVLICVSIPTLSETAVNAASHFPPGSPLK